MLTVTIGSGNLAIAGNLLDNMLISGSGTDTLAGGDGNDTYVVNQSGDGIVEGIDGGTDLVQSSVTYTLAANVENLTLTGAGNIDGSGNGDGNTISGNDGDNSTDWRRRRRHPFRRLRLRHLRLASRRHRRRRRSHHRLHRRRRRRQHRHQCLLSTYDPLNDDIAMFVQVVDDGSNSTINIDPTGSSTFSVSVVEIDGLTGVTLEQLRANNNLVA